ncbi:MAG: anti-sigma factor antagonist [Flavobacteriia bacterium]|jgi:anti-anti-sigma factor|nr:anti-sigma factor antagonist [Flavobacteriia bacterium]NBV67656.1 anti-sigma factor antagonist [Flavobacteriia bacterium]NBV91779.1 anti-sigma factor antagonist [Flavobacteriia bacterium]NBY39631.1 anti-sigma factor antagonist [Flavobacteriia bacterium]
MALKQRKMIDYFITNGETTCITLDGKLLSDADLKAVTVEIEKLKNWSIVLDLKELSHVNSSGIAFLVRILTRSRVNGGDTVICNLNASLRKLFDITKMHEIFVIYNSQEEANAHFKK